MAPIDEYQQQITAWKEESLTDSEIIGRLYDNGVEISQRTLSRRLQTWGVRKHTNVAVTDAIVERVQELYLQNLFSDAQIASRIIDEAGNSPTANQVKQIRLERGLQRRVQRHDPQISASRSEATQAAVTHLFHEGGGRSFGYRWVQASLRRRLGHNARQSDIRSTLRQIDPIGVDSRNPRLQRRPIERQNYETAGPDEV
jgi:hypothetical protein